MYDLTCSFLVRWFMGRVIANAAAVLQLYSPPGFQNQQAALWVEVGCAGKVGCSGKGIAFLNWKGGSGRREIKSQHATGWPVPAYSLRAASVRLLEEALSTVCFHWVWKHQQVVLDSPGLAFCLAIQRWIYFLYQLTCTRWAVRQTRGFPNHSVTHFANPQMTTREFQPNSS